MSERTTFRGLLVVLMLFSAAQCLRPRPFTSGISLASLMSHSARQSESAVDSGGDDGGDGSKLRLQSLRSVMAEENIDAFIVPTDDPHLSEYTSPYYQRRAFISGFTGSAGTAIVTRDEALLFTDGRYHNQAAQELNGCWKLMKSGLKGVPTVNEWLQANLQSGAVIGIDPAVHSAENVKKAEERFTKNGMEMKCLQVNPVDKIWNDFEVRPDCPATAVRRQDLEFAGKSVNEKLGEVREHLREKEVGALVISALDEIAYIFNIRGADIPCNPVTIAYAMITMDAAYLFADESKFSDESVRKQLTEAGVEISPYERASSMIFAQSKDGKVWVDGKRTNFAIYNNVASASSLYDRNSPISLMKACKNEAELNAMRACHLRDGAAMAEFFAELEGLLDPTSPHARSVSEVDIDEMVCRHRTHVAAMLEPSFPTIAGAEGNGAIIHYCADPASCKSIEPSSSGVMILLDSGGQYFDGTTDVTRTFHTGSPSPHQKEMFTRVLKGNIGLEKQIFPVGTAGCFLDSFAREHLWKAGKDYMHGTGHGVGAALNVHEGPQRISRVLDQQALLEGMIVSNEPGYYEEGKFGVRIENLLIVVPRYDIASFSGRGFLGFEKLTMIPIQHNCMDFDLLAPDEIAWIDSYHAEIREKVAPFVESERGMRWLERFTITCAEFRGSSKR